MLTIDQAQAHLNNLLNEPYFCPSRNYRAEIKEREFWALIVLTFDASVEYDQEPDPTISREPKYETGQEMIAIDIDHLTEDELVRKVKERVDEIEQTPMIINGEPQSLWCPAELTGPTATI